MNENMEHEISKRIQQLEFAAADEAAKRATELRQQEVYSALSSPEGLNIDSANFLTKETKQLIKGFVYSMQQASAVPDKLIWDSRWEETSYGIFKKGRQVKTYREGWLLSREAYTTWNTDRDGHTSGPNYTAYQQFYVSPDNRISGSGRTDYQTSVNSTWDPEVIKTSIIDKLISKSVAWHNFPEQNAEN